MAVQEEANESEAVEAIVDRQAALLTKRQRQVLIRDSLSDEERIKRNLVESNSELAEREDVDPDNVVSNAVIRNRRKGARDRIIHSILDMNIINETFTPSDYGYMFRQLTESDEFTKQGWYEGEQALADFLYTITGIGGMEDLVASAILNVESQRANHLVNSDETEDVYPFEVEFDISAEVTFKFEDSEASFAEIEEKYEDESQELTETEELIYYTFQRLSENKENVDK